MGTTVRSARIGSAIISGRLETPLFGLATPCPEPLTLILPLEKRPPRTEFLDAETGGQKSALETADVYRDRKSGNDTGEILAKTASLESPTKCAVWEDWMVVCAVRYEPVSLLSGQKQGDFREKQREDYRKYENAPETGHFSFFRINR
jgi:hypothetical protein